MSQWTPIVEGAVAERCIQTAREIAAALQERPPEDASLSSGNAGCTLLHAYLHEHEPEAGHDEHALASLDRAIDALGSDTLTLELFDGLPGIAWVSEHLQGRLLARGEEDANADVDEILLRELEAPGAGVSWDLLAGFIGHGVYALERLRGGNGREILVQLVAVLERRAEVRPVGLTWRTDSSLLAPEKQAAAPNGVMDLGVAHGVPGVIAFLSALHRADIERARVGKLLAGAVAWTLAQRLPSSSPSAFAYYAAPEGDGAPARLAWCRGDAGACVALLAAGHATATAAWTDAALDIALHATLRRDDAGVHDACLCHGAAGLAHTFARLFHATGDARFAAAGRYWIDRALAMRRPSEGFAGYARYFDGRMLPTAGFLMGSAGVALGLLSAATTVEPAWDACLLY